MTTRVKEVGEATRDDNKINFYELTRADVTCHHLVPFYLHHHPVVNHNNNNFILKWKLQVQWEHENKNAI